MGGTLILAGLGLWFVFTGPAQAARVGTCPPENVTVKVVEPSGAPLWIDFTGSGCNGDSPVRDAVTQLIADGFYLRARPVGACGWKANPCVVIGP